MTSAALTEMVRAGANVAAKQGELTKLKKACQGLESSFLRQLLGEMRKSVQEIHVGDDTGGDTLRGMADDALADRLAERGTLGIANRTFGLMAGQVLDKPFDKANAPKK